MRKKLLIIIPAGVLALTAATLGGLYAHYGLGWMISQFAAIDRTDMMRAESFTSTDGITLPYRIYVPEGTTAALPLVLYLHGAGERGDCNRAHTRKNSVMQTLLNDENRVEFPAIVIAPQCPAGTSWQHLTAELMSLLEDVMAAYPVDAGRVYITGISMGGNGTWEMLAAYPNFFAAAVPICGWGTPESAYRFSDVPIWVFHGARDRGILPEYSREMVQALENAGSNVRYTEYPRETHQAWEIAYREAELFPWMFAQTRTD